MSEYREQPVKVGIIGLGTVGAGTVNVLKRNADEIARRAGREIHIARAAVRNLDGERDCDLAGIELGTDPMAIAADPDIDVVVEMIGGTDVARDVVAASIANGKHVVTANKALIAEHGNVLFAAASDMGVTIAFESAVGGGIPIIKVIREGLAGNRVDALVGIVNGTSNYILSAMHESDVAFDDVLKEAQALGYAESDPTFDVGGIDAAHKLTILASIAFGIPLAFESVHIEGISDIEPLDVAYAKELGYRIKHLGIAKRVTQPGRNQNNKGAGVEMRVHPTLIPEERLLANVDGVMNAIMIEGDAVGQSIHHGAGAGAEPTASAVVADLVDVVRALTTDPDNRVPHLAFQPDAMSKIGLIPMEDTHCAFYLRLMAINRPGVLARVTKILGDLDISIEAIVQKGSGESERKLPIIIITQRTLQSNMTQALDGLRQLEDVEDEIVKLRLEHLA